MATIVDVASTIAFAAALACIIWMLASFSLDKRKWTLRAAVIGLVCLVIAVILRVSGIGTAVDGGSEAEVEAAFLSGSGRGAPFGALSSTAGLAAGAIVRYVAGSS